MEVSSEETGGTDVDKMTTPAQRPCLRLMSSSAYEIRKARPRSLALLSCPDHCRPFPNRLIPTTGYAMPFDFAAYEIIFLTHGKRTITFAGPASLADLKERVRSHFGFRCNDRAMRTTCYEKQHSIVELADDALSCSESWDRAPACNLKLD